MGSVTTTSSKTSVASEGGLLVSWGGSGASGTRFGVIGKIGFVGGLFHQLYKAPPTTNRATPTSMVEEAVI